VNELPKHNKMPAGLVLEKSPAFVPKMAMTDELRTVVCEVIRQWDNRHLFDGLAKFGIRPLDRLLFFGPPGNGKTMACQWIARKLDIPLYRVQCEQIRGRYLGETTRALADVTRYLMAQPDPAVCLLDEIESIFVDRSRAVGECDRELGSALTVFFQALDRWSSPMLLVMCTNLVDQVDRALLSRIELQLEFRPPTEQQALDVIAYWRELLCDHGGDQWSEGLTHDIAVRGTPESFRELQQAINRAARAWVAAKIGGEEE